ncbi:MAG: hypothetical protein ACTSW1_07795 [Candidatus Hodarchaeales archaeon]
MNKTKESPCKNCLCVPVCKQKSYAVLNTDCSLLCLYLYTEIRRPASKARNKFFDERIYKVEEEVKPNKWRVLREKEIIQGRVNETIKIQGRRKIYEPAVY